MIWTIAANIGGLAGLAALILAVVAYFKFKPEIKQILAGARLSDASASESIQRAAVALIAPLEKRIDALQAELRAEREARSKMEVTIGRLRAGIRTLIAQLEQHNITPCWKLEDDE